MILSSPPLQFGQVCISMSNTRLSSRAQLMRPDRNWMGSASHAVATTAWLASSGCVDAGGPTNAHSLALDASTPMEADQVQPWPQNQCRQPLHELQGTHHQMRRAVAPRLLELELDLAGGIQPHRRRSGALTAARYPLSVSPCRCQLRRLSSFCACAALGKRRGDVMASKPDDKKAGDDAGKPSTQDIQLAWAKIVARASVDPDFLARVRSDARAVFAEFGVALAADFDLAKGLAPTLDEALATIAQQRSYAQGGSMANSNATSFTQGTVASQATHASQASFPCSGSWGQGAAGGRAAAAGNCWGSAGTIGSAGTFGGCAGTVGTGGCYGCAGDAAMGAAGGRAAAAGNCWGSAGTIGSAGTFGGCTWSRSRRRSAATAVRASPAWVVARLVALRAAAAAPLAQPAAWARLAAPPARPPPWAATAAPAWPGRLAWRVAATAPSAPPAAWERSAAPPARPPASAPTTAREWPVVSAA